MATALQATTTVTEVVQLKPSVRRRLLVHLKTFAAAKAQMDALKTQMDEAKASIGAIREETGENSLSLDGFKVTRVSGTTKSLDKKKLVELGCALAWIEEATTEKPKKAYELVTCPGEVERVYE